MKKSFISVLCMALFCLTANAQSISDAIRKFDTAMLNAQIAKGETVISSIHYADTDSSGSIVEWIKREIKLAASQPQNPRLQIVQSNMLLQEEQNMVIATTRGVPIQKTKSFGNKKFVITGMYQERKDEIELFLYLDSSDGKSFSSAKVLIPMKEVTERKLTLYPQNVELAKSEFKDIKAAQSIAKRTPEKSIVITAAMLDSENNMVDILYPDSRVHFIVGSPEKDAYIAIQNLSAKGKTSWLDFDRKKTKVHFIEAGTTWNSPNFYPVDNVYGIEYIHIYASSSPDELPVKKSEEKYTSGSISKNTRELILASSSDEVATGTFALSYTVLPTPVE